MSSEEWVEDDPPTNILGKISRIIFPKKKKVKKTKKENIVPETETKTSEALPETEQKQSKEDKNKKNHKKKEKTDEEWVDDVKPKKQTVEPDLSRGLPGNLTIKRAIATILFLVYIVLLIYVVRFEIFSTVICITTLIVLLDYLAITRGKTEQWDK